MALAPEWMSLPKETDSSSHGRSAYGKERERGGTPKYGRQHSYHNLTHMPPPSHGHGPDLKPPSATFSCSVAPAPFSPSSTSFHGLPLPGEINPRILNRSKSSPGFGSPKPGAKPKLKSPDRTNAFERNFPSSLSKQHKPKPKSPLFPPSYLKSHSQPNLLNSEKPTSWHQPPPVPPSSLSNHRPASPHPPPILHTHTPLTPPTTPPHHTGSMSYHAASSHHLSSSHHPPSTSHHMPSSSHHPPSSSHHPPSASHYPPSASHHPPSTSHHPPSTSHHPPSTSHHPPSTAHHTNPVNSHTTTSSLPTSTSPTPTDELDKLRQLVPNAVMPPKSVRPRALVGPPPPLAKRTSSSSLSSPLAAPSSPSPPPVMTGVPSAVQPNQLASYFRKATSEPILLHHQEVRKQPAHTKKAEKAHLQNRNNFFQIVSNQGTEEDDTPIGHENRPPTPPPPPEPTTAPATPPGVKSPLPENMEDEERFLRELGWVPESEDPVPVLAEEEMADVRVKIFLSKGGNSGGGGGKGEEMRGAARVGVGGTA